MRVGGFWICIMLAMLAGSAIGVAADSAVYATAAYLTLATFVWIADAICTAIRERP